MSDKNLGEALLKIDLTPASAATAVQIDRIIETDRRRIRLLTRLTVGLWIVAALGAIAIAVGSWFVFPAIALALNEAKEANQPNTPFLMLAKLMAMCIVFGSLSFAILVVAGLATVLLVFRSRRATLRQINANLLQISEELKHVAIKSAG
jgi:hypothetical protein